MWNVVDPYDSIKVNLASPNFKGISREVFHCAWHASSLLDTQSVVGIGVQARWCYLFWFHKTGPCTTKRWDRKICDVGQGTEVHQLFLFYRMLFWSNVGFMEFLEILRCNSVQHSSGKSSVPDAGDWTTQTYVLNCWVFLPRLFVVENSKNCVVLQNVRTLQAYKVSEVFSNLQKIL